MSQYDKEELDDEYDVEEEEKEDPGDNDGDDMIDAAKFDAHTKWTIY
jgi:hypothetical protein